MHVQVSRIDEELELLDEPSFWRKMWKYWGLDVEFLGALVDRLLIGQIRAHNGQRHVTDFLQGARRM